MRRTRGSGASNGSRSPASSAQARCGPSGPDSASASARPVSRRSPRIVASTAAPAASTASRPPGGSRGTGPVGRRERRQVTVEPRRVPPPARPVERVRARADRLVRPPLPVGEVVPALVPGPAPSSRSRSRGTRPRRAAPRRASYCAAARSSSCSSDRPRPPAARARARGQVIAGRPVSPSASGSSSVSAYAETWSGASAERRVERRRPGASASAPGRRTAGRATRSRCPPPRASATAAATSAGRCRRPSRRSSPSSNDCAPSEIRVTPASTSARASPRSSGPGFASIVTSAPSAIPNRVAHAIEDGRDRRAGQQRRRPAAEVQRLEGGRRGDPTPNEASAASARSPISVEQRADERPRRGPAARAPPPPHRRRSRSTGTARRRTGRGRRARPAAAGDERHPGPRRRPPGYWSRDGPRRSPSTRQPSGVACRRCDLFLLGALRLRQPGVPGREEDRDPGDRVAEERRADAAGDPDQPAAGEADRERGHEHVPRPPGRPEPRGQRVERAPG